MNVRSIRELIQEKIFEKFYLQPFDGSSKHDLYAGKLERSTHGVMHASRTAIWVGVFINLYKEIGNEEIELLTEEDIFYLQIVALFHDSGRKGENKDIWEAESRENCQLFLENIGLSTEKAYYYASLITSKEMISLDPKLNIMRTILQSADSLDILRCKKVFEISNMHAYHAFKKANAISKLESLVKNASQIIAEQKDLMYNCKIQLKNNVLFNIDASINPQYGEKSFLQKKRFLNLTSNINDNPDDLKKNYEQSPKCFEKLFTDINNNEFLQKYNLLPQFDKTATLAEKPQELKRIKIREKAPTVKIDDIFFIKSVRPIYFGEYLDGIIPPNNIHHPLRRGSKKKYRVTGIGPELRETKKSLYTAEEKKDFSKPQAVSIGTPSYHPPAFNFADRVSKSTGTIFLNKKNILLTNHIYTHDFGSDGRLSDFDDEFSAEMYFTRAKNTLYSKDTFDDFIKAIEDKKYRKLKTINESLARIKWTPDQSCLNFINTDTLESRLLAQAEAQVIKNRLLNKNSCDESYEVPICYYKPEDPSIHLKIYTPEEQQLDRELAAEIAKSPSLRQLKYFNNDFEFLYALPETDLNNILPEIYENSSTLLTLATQGLQNNFLATDFLALSEILMELKLLSPERLNKSIDEVCSFLTNFTEGVRTNHLDSKMPPTAEDLMMLKLGVSYLQWMLNSAILTNNQNIFKRIVFNFHIHPSLIGFSFFIPETIVNTLMLCFNQKKNTSYLDLILNLAIACTNQLKLYDKAELTSFSGVTPMHLAAQFGYPGKIGELNNAGFSTNCKDKQGKTPLHYAAETGELETIKTLLKLNPELLHMEDNKGKTAFELAIANDKLSVMKFFIENHGIDPNCINKKGQNIFHVALKKNAATILTYTGESLKTTNINNKDYLGKTPLHQFVKNYSKFSYDSFSKIICGLINVGAKFSIKNNEGLSIGKQYLQTNQMLGLQIICTQDFIINARLNELNKHTFLSNLINRKNLLNEIKGVSKENKTMAHVIAHFDELLDRLDKEIDITKNIDALDAVASDLFEKHKHNIQFLNKIISLVDAAYSKIKDQGDKVIDQLNNEVDRMLNPPIKKFEWAKKLSYLFNSKKETPMDIDSKEEKKVARPNI